MDLTPIGGLVEFRKKIEEKLRLAQEEYAHDLETLNRMRALVEKTGNQKGTPTHSGPGASSPAFTGPPTFASGSAGSGSRAESFIGPKPDTFNEKIAWFGLRLAEQFDFQGLWDFIRKEDPVFGGSFDRHRLSHALWEIGKKGTRLATLKTISGHRGKIPAIYEFVRN